jgi:hypothetical protein
MFWMPLAPPSAPARAEDADDDQAEGQRGHREIVAAKAQRDEAEHEAEQPASAVPSAVASNELQPERTPGGMIPRRW